MGFAESQRRTFPPSSVVAGNAVDVFFSLGISLLTLVESLLAVSGHSRLPSSLVAASFIYALGHEYFAVLFQFV